MICLSPGCRVSCFQDLNESDGLKMATVPAPLFGHAVHGSAHKHTRGACQLSTKWFSSHIIQHWRSWWVECWPCILSLWIRLTLHTAKRRSSTQVTLFHWRSIRLDVVDLKWVSSSADVKLINRGDEYFLISECEVCTGCRTLLKDSTTVSSTEGRYEKRNNEPENTDSHGKSPIRERLT